MLIIRATVMNWYRGFYKRPQSGSTAIRSCGVLALYYLGALRGEEAGAVIYSVSYRKTMLLFNLYIFHFSK